MWVACGLPVRKMYTGTPRWGTIGPRPTAALPSTTQQLGKGTVVQYRRYGGGRRCARSDVLWRNVLLGVVLNGYCVYTCVYSLGYYYYYCDLGRVTLGMPPDRR